jgi:hypothetical protein
MTKTIRTPITLEPLCVVWPAPALQASIAATAALADPAFPWALDAAQEQLAERGIEDTQQACLYVAGTACFAPSNVQGATFVSWAQQPTALC